MFGNRFNSSWGAPIPVRSVVSFIGSIILVVLTYSQWAQYIWPGLKEITSLETGTFTHDDMKLIWVPALVYVLGITNLMLLINIFKPLSCYRDGLIVVTAACFLGGPIWGGILFLIGLTPASFALTVALFVTFCVNVCMGIIIEFRLPGHVASR